MADKKISQLTGASTPLAGTEVLPIVQSGSTVKVSAADVTAGRAISALTYTSTATTGTAPFTVSSTTQVANLNAATAGTANNLKSNATTGVIQVVGPAAASTRVMTTPDANFTVARTDAGQTFTGNNNVDGLLGVNTGPNTDGQIRIYNTTTRVLGAKYGVRFADSSFETNGSIYMEQTAGGNNSAEMAFVANAGTGGIQITSGQEFLRGYGNGNAKIPAGNLVVGTAGKGIDFSANTHAAGMTSELLNWYEEGIATVTLAFGGASTGIVYTNQELRYTRIGNRVMFQLGLAISNKGSSTGAATISGLPFSSKNLSYGGSLFTVNAQNMAGSAGVIFALLPENSSTLELKNINAAGNANVDFTDAAWGSGSYVTISGQYLVG